MRDVKEDKWKSLEFAVGEVKTEWVIFDVKNCKSWRYEWRTSASSSDPGMLGQEGKLFSLSGRV